MTDNTNNSIFLHNSFGSVPTLGGLSTIPNRVNDSVTPAALGSGILTGILQSSNYKTGVSGWQIRPDGNVEFASGTFRLDLVGNTYKTVSTLPTSGSGILIDSNGFHAYASGNKIFDISGSVISFLTSAGLSSATVTGYTPSELDISIANGGGLQINSSYLAPSSATMTLGDSVAGVWTDSFVTKMHLGTSTSVFITSGTGSPEGAVTASVGSIFLRTDGGATTTLYVKTSGTGNTGWTAK